MTASSLLLAFGLMVVLGGLATAWLWLVQRPRAERDEGLRLLASMRWREFSRLVVDGLRARGFEPEGAADAAERGQDSVLHLTRDGRKWLLSCKQATHGRITPTMVHDMSDAVRFHGAQGGVIATLGEVEDQARKPGGVPVELLDGHSLWPLTRMQLGPSVREELHLKSRRAAVRQSAIAWGSALAVGLLVAASIPQNDGSATHDAADATDAAGAAPPAVRAPADAAISPAPVLASAPVSEEEQRSEVVRLVSTLQGVEHAAWTTRSTLMISLASGNTDPVAQVCAVVERYESLRTSRLHLQPPADSQRPARFLQCRTF